MKNKIRQLLPQCILILLLAALLLVPAGCAKSADAPTSTKSPKPFASMNPDQSVSPTMTAAPATVTATAPPDTSQPQTSSAGVTLIPNLPKISIIPKVSMLPALPGTKAAIQNTLISQNAYDITWAPDNSAVVYIVDSSSDSKIYLWKTGDTDPTYVIKNSGTTSGFSWSPNSKYFLINAWHMGPGTYTSLLYKASTLEPLSQNIISASLPVFRPDSNYLALTTANNNGTVALQIYTISSQSTSTLLQKTNTAAILKVVSWGSDDLIHYTESAGGVTSDKTIPFIG